MEIMGGSRDKADGVLDAYNDFSTDVGTSKTYQDTSLTEWNDFLEEIQTNRHIDGRGTDDDNLYHQNYWRVVELVKKFSRVTCCYLLQQWLASTALCDISFILTICRADQPEQQQHKQPSKKKNHTVDHFSTMVGVDDHTWNYSIKIIDCDPKPVVKLRQREKKESAMQNFKSDSSS